MACHHLLTMQQNIAFGCSVFGLESMIGEMLDQCCGGLVGFGKKRSCPCPARMERGNSSLGTQRAEQSATKTQECLWFSQPTRGPYRLNPKRGMFVLGSKQRQVRQLRQLLEEAPSKQSLCFCHHALGSPRSTTAFGGGASGEEPPQRHRKARLCRRATEPGPRKPAQVPKETRQSPPH